MKIIPYLNPFSTEQHEARAQFKKLSGKQQALTVVATAFATLVGLPFFLVGGIATGSMAFRKMVESFPQANSATMKTDQEGRKSLRALQPNSTKEKDLPQPPQVKRSVSDHIDSNLPPPSKTKSKNSESRYYFENNTLHRSKNGKITTYKRGATLGVGKGSTVYSFKPESGTGKPKAVKHYNKNLQNDPNSRDLDQLERERKLFFSEEKFPKNALNIAVPKAILDDKENSFLIMSQMEGTFDKVIEYLSDEEQISAISQLIQGIYELHSRGVATGDLHLENILFKRKGDGTIEYKITDFGCAGKDISPIGDIIVVRGIIRAILLKTNKNSHMAGQIPENDTQVPPLLKKFNNSLSIQDSIFSIQKKWNDFLESR